MAQLAPFLMQILVAMAISVIAYALMPKPKMGKPPAAQDWENPTASAGREIPVVFGRVKVKGVNLLWYGDKSYQEYEV